MSHYEVECFVETGTQIKFFLKKQRYAIMPLKTVLKKLYFRFNAMMFQLDVLTQIDAKTFWQRHRFERMRNQFMTA